jgi:inorganic pyrophosphatase
MVPLCLVSARVIGVMRMIDGGKTDDKIIAVAVNDPSVNHLQDIDELSEHFIAELRNFFENYTKLENKTVIVDQFLNKENALKILSENFDAYQKAFKS